MMIIVSTDKIQGYDVVQVLGLAKGNIVQSKHVGKDIVAAFRQVVGGEIKEYTEMFTEARQKATKRMVEDAEKQGANAIINVRYVNSQVMQGASELLVYGTAVIIKENDKIEQLARSEKEKK